MMRDALIFPTSLTPEEKKFKEMQEHLKNLRRRLESTKGGCPNEMVERELKRKKIEEAASNTEELKRKIASGAISLNKVGEKREFKRSKGVERRLSHDSRKDSLSSLDGLISPPLRPDPPKKEPKPSPMLYIRGIDLHDELLERLFTPFGEIKGCEIDARKRTGFVWMNSIDEAAQAIEKLDKTGVDQWTLHVSYALYPRPVGSHRRTTSMSSTTSEGLASPPIPSLMAWDAASAKSSERRRIAHSSD
ncbi:hypothetical protein PENTCL1PPCAC_27000 [Pristionchus entomophagus]|uniref:Negative elongation factor E n=1 Tax=Pristionchus entomophagus TaxID=358040 RepID=A0AAV5UCX9_9BILA|nr:hypothetical protein PENTCL1PPCAC_27000 [Pristionchus entomophagus]